MNVVDNVSLPLSLKLKTIGFNLPCTSYYTNEDFPKEKIRRIHLVDGRLEDYNNLKDLNPIAVPVCSAPSFHTALEWLREKHRIHCFAVVDDDVEDGQTEIWKGVVQWVDGGLALPIVGHWKSWTEAIEAAINHAITQVS